VSAADVWCTLYGATFIAFGSVVALKGKWVSLALGLALPPVWIVAALRMARPRSYWARHYYDVGQVIRAERRYGLAPTPGR
jgi:hypothetical protein